MPALDWSFGQPVDCSSTLFASKPTPPHSIAPNISPNTASFGLTPAHLRRPSLAHTTASSQILQPATPRLPDSNVDIILPAANGGRPRMNTRTSSFAGRKRSRQEFGDGEPYDDSDISAPSSKAHSPAKSFLEDEDAMMNTELSNRATAQELAERADTSFDLDRIQTRPVLESRKSVRLDTDSAIDDSHLTPEMVRPKTGSGSHDPATIALGPSWSTMLPYDPKHAHLQSAMRGWTVYIEAQYPLRNVKFEYRKKSDPTGYLVGAVMTQDGYKWRGGSLGYFLFDESLKSCRLVAKSWNTALDCLRTGLFEGDEVMIAHDHQHGYGLHGEGLDPDGVALLQGQSVTFTDTDLAMDGVAVPQTVSQDLTIEDTGMDLD